MVDLILPELSTNYLSDLSKVLGQSGLQSSAPLIITDCFAALACGSPSLSQFQPILKSDASLTPAVLTDVYNRFFGLVAAIYKNAISSEEYKGVLAALELPESMFEDCSKPFLEIAELLKLKKKGWEGVAKVAERTHGSMDEQLGDDYFGVRFAEIVNVEWTGMQEICAMHAGGIYESKFSVKLYVLTNDCDTGVACKKPLSASFHRLQIKVVEFVCTQAELQHLFYQVNEALCETGRVGGGA